MRATLDGVVHHEIRHYAEENDIDMIVIGTHGHSDIAAMFLGSVTEKVVRHSPCPVLTVHSDDHQFYNCRR